MTQATESKRVMGLILALVSGVVFAAGLVLAGMTQPAKVIGFLNVAGMFKGSFPGTWDPTLAFVMGGAVLVTLVGFGATQTRLRKPLLGTQFVLPTRTQIDRPLVLGAAIFGVGWGLSGYCPGPALASILTGGADALLFVGAMVVGMVLARRWMGVS